MRALQSLSADSIEPLSIEAEESSRPNYSHRAEKAVSKILSILSPLVSLSQFDKVRLELLELARLAIGI
jgi:hypothetical protein